MTAAMSRREPISNAGRHWSRSMGESYPPQSHCTTSVHSDKYMKPLQVQKPDSKWMQTLSCDPLSCTYCTVMYCIHIVWRLSVVYVALLCFASCKVPWSCTMRSSIKLVKQHVGANANNRTTMQKHIFTKHTDIQKLTLDEMFSVIRVMVVLSDSSSEI